MAEATENYSTQQPAGDSKFTVAAPQLSLPKGGGALRSSARSASSGGRLRIAPSFPIGRGRPSIRGAA